MLLETVDVEGRCDNFIDLIEGELDIPDSATRH